LSSFENKAEILYKLWFLQHAFVNSSVFMLVPQPRESHFAAVGLIQYNMRICCTPSDQLIPC